MNPCKECDRKPENCCDSIPLWAKRHYSCWNDYQDDRAEYSKPEYYEKTDVDDD